MHVQFIPDTSKVTFRDRIIAAYYAFRMRVKPDLETMLKLIEQQRYDIEERQAEREGVWLNALENLQPYDAALAESVAGATYNWQELFDGQLMPAIKKLDVPTQIAIMRHIFTNNRQIVATREFCKWMNTNAEEILDALPECADE